VSHKLCGNAPRCSTGRSRSQARIAAVASMLGKRGGVSRQSAGCKANLAPLRAPDNDLTVIVTRLLHSLGVIAMKLPDSRCQHGSGSPKGGMPA
jgi:hypothetical protein